MKRLLCLPSAYLALPILLACGLTLLTYDLPVDYLQGLLLLVVIAAAIMLFDVQAGVRIPPATRFRARSYAGTRDAFVALAFAGPDRGFLRARSRAVSHPAVQQAVVLRRDGGRARTYPARVGHVLGASADRAAVRQEQVAAQRAHRRRLPVSDPGDRPQPGLRHRVLVCAGHRAAPGRGQAHAMESRRLPGVRRHQRLLDTRHAALRAAGSRHAAVQRDVPRGPGRHQMAAPLRQRRALQLQLDPGQGLHQHQLPHQPGRPAERLRRDGRHDHPAGCAEHQRGYGVLPVPDGARPVRRGGLRSSCCTRCCCGACSACAPRCRCFPC